MERYLAERVKKIDSSGIRKVFALAAELEEPINFSIGQPDFDVPEELKKIAIEAIKRGYNKYTQTTGDEQLREKIAQMAAEQFGWGQPSVLVTSGVSGGILLAFMSLINPGDEVIIPDPYFVMYKHLVNLLGGKCVYVDSYPDFGLPVDGIADVITERTKLIILNSPCNPTGAVYSEEEIKGLAKAAREKNVIVLSDEIYEEFCYDEPGVSIGKYYEKSLILGGFSKTYAMTGWRLGYAVAGEALSSVIEEMTKIQQYTFVCAPSPFQKAAIAAMDYDMSEYAEAYKRKRDIVFEGLKDNFGLKKPGGAFYAFVKSPVGSATEFVEKAIKENVLIIPGNIFSERDSHFRLSYATDDGKIREGVEILNKLYKET